ncbi:MAG TPA: MFS transporter [Pseudonocardiaceae bacterium]
MLVSGVITQLMIVLDMTVIAIALPKMQTDLGMTSDQRPWVVTAYTLAFGGLVLFGGRLTGVMGIRWAYRVGLVGFALSSLVAGLAPSFAVLVTARAVQGAFGALLAPTVLALINATFTEPTGRTRAMGILGATGGLGAAVGLMVGGVLTDTLNWRWCLYVNVGIAAIALLVSARSLPRTQRSTTTRITDDMLGLISGCAAIFSIVYGLNQAQEHDWTSHSTIAWLVAGGVLAVLFVLREWRAHVPVLPLWIMTHPARGASYTVQFLSGAAQMGAFLYLTYYFQDYLGYSPLKSGVYFLPMVGALIITAIVGGRILIPRLGAKGMYPLGLAVQAVAFFLFSRMTVDSTYTQVALPSLIVYGIGVGLTLPMTFNAGTRDVPENKSGLASAVLNASQQIGSSFGIALLATYATQLINDYIRDNQASATANATKALIAAGAPQNSPTGQRIISQLREQFTAHAQLHAYSGGFTLLVWILGTAAVLLLIAGVTFAVVVRSRRRGQRTPVSAEPVTTEFPAAPAEPTTVEFAAAPTALSAPPSAEK